jgi:Thioredoxin
MTTVTTTNYKSYVDKAISYDAYVKAFEDTIAHNTPLPEEAQIPLFKYYPLNLQRVHRIYKQYQLADDIKGAIDGLNAPIHWLVITEPWCGDASQSLPVIAKIADASGGKIQLHIVYRDENLELMDQFLTNGGRSIPKLIQLDEGFNLTTHWGPRPANVQELFLSLKAQGLDHDAYAEIVHKWYAGDKAQSISKELVDVLALAK